MDLQLNDTSFRDLVYYFNKSTKPSDVDFIYEGEINHKILTTFTSMTESNLQDEDTSVQRKVFSVMVECLQNISMHADCEGQIKKANSGNGIFLVSNNNKELTIVTGNAILKEKESFLSRRINFINKLSKDDLKKYYKKILRASIISAKGGAGLGFIDIVKKTQNELSYKFHSINDKYSFFVLSAKITK